MKEFAHWGWLTADLAGVHWWSPKQETVLICSTGCGDCTHVILRLSKINIIIYYGLIVAQLCKRCLDLQMLHNHTSTWKQDHTVKKRKTKRSNLAPRFSVIYCFALFIIGVYIFLSNSTNCLFYFDKTGKKIKQCYFSNKIAVEKKNNFLQCKHNKISITLSNKLLCLGYVIN